MPMIDVYAPAGTFSDKHALAQELAQTIMRWEKVPAILFFSDNPEGHECALQQAARPGFGAAAAPAVGTTDAGDGRRSGTQHGRAHRPPVADRGLGTGRPRYDTRTSSATAVPNPAKARPCPFRARSPHPIGTSRPPALGAWA